MWRAARSARPRSGSAGCGREVCGAVVVHRAVEPHSAGEPEPFDRRLQAATSGLVRRNEVGGAQLPDVEEGEPRMFDRFGDPLRQVGVERGPPVHVPGAVDTHGSADVEWMLQVASGGGRGDRPVPGGGGVLAPGHPEVEVVEHQHRDPDVAPRGIDEVGTADPGAAVAHDHDHGELGARQLDPGGVGDAATVQPMEGAGGEVLVGKPSASNVGDDHNPGRVDGQGAQRLVESVEDAAVPAPGTERIRGVVAVLNGDGDGHAAAARICSGEINSPSTRSTPITVRPPAMRSNSRRYNPGLSSGTITRSTPASPAPMAVSGTGHSVCTTRPEIRSPLLRAVATAARTAPPVMP